MNMYMLYCIGITVAAYTFSLWAGKRYRSPFTTPVFLSTAVIISVLVISHVSYQAYVPAQHIMTFLLGPATVALAVPLYKNRAILQKHAVPAVNGLITGALASLLAAVALVKVFQLKQLILIAFSVKSVTVPIAVEITRVLKGDPSLAAAFVVCTGILGAMIGPFLLDISKINHPLSRGLALGTISHGQGTAQAAQEGELQGSIAAVAMGLSAIFTAVVVPSIFSWLA
ncbi:LrgB family protein [Ectobacillus ponti]|uniref:LrgB family protein n=1 Tax=Ectobacillus ponti TaxID=2961894 RepID=A0AA41XB14_9BACI|nr:LrgB family protein [Ectobacillus ponti]MCP8969645.1 LrgB family protein [Ectobacillus ponti]